MFLFYLDYSYEPESNLDGCESILEYYINSLPITEQLSLQRKREQQTIKKIKR
jgi:hypothetical protein